MKPRNSTVSFDNPRHKERLAFLKLIVDYYKLETSKNFQAYGQLLRPLTFTTPSPMPMSSEEGEFPLVMNGVFRSDNGELGIFVVNAGRQQVQFSADMDTSSYGITADTRVDVAHIAADGTEQKVHRNVSGEINLRGSLSGHGITMFLISPANR